MLIGKPEISDRGDRVRATCRIEWEDCDVNPKDVFVEAPSGYMAHSLVVSSAFTLLCALPALHKGERRISVQGGADPMLIGKLNVAIAQLSHWYGYARNSFLIEYEKRTPQLEPVSARAATFFSGGCDSFYTLYNNHHLALDQHPLRIRDLIIAYGFDMGWREPSEDEFELFNRAITSLVPVAKASDTSVLPIRTNVRALLNNANFWAARWHGMVLAGVAYILSGRIADAFIPSTNDLWHQSPWGSSPLLDPGFTTNFLRIHHDGLDKTRLDKVRAISNWPLALENLRVCTKTTSVADGNLNCGICEKCLRTKLELLACGAMNKCTAFADRNINLENVRSIKAFTAYQASEYSELIEPLRFRGEEQLADAVEAIVQGWHRYDIWQREEDWKGLAKKFLRRYFGVGNKAKQDLFPVK